MLTNDLRVRLRAGKPELMALLARLAEDARTTARRERLILWGWPESEVRETVERLGRRDHKGDDDRVSCVDCEHFRGGRCCSHRLAALQSPEVGRDLGGMLQHCAAFSRAHPARPERPQSHSSER